MNWPRAASSQPRARRLSWSPPTWLRTTIRTAMARPRAKRSQTVRSAAAGESRDGVVERMGKDLGRGELNYTLPFVNQERIAAPARPAWARPMTWTAVVCLYTALTFVYFWPLPRLWQDYLGPDPGDPIFNLYVLKWGVHKIR